MRRKALAANSFLLNSRSRPKTDQYIDQYGFSVDGPILKNKTFFLFTGEKYREGTPAPLFSTVPTPAMKNGDFSGLVDASGNLIVIYDPATGRDVNGVWTRDPFPGNIIPADRINPTARAIMQYCPEPEQHRRRRRAVADGTWRGPSTSTRTCSGTGSARSTTTSAPTTGPSSAGARTSGTRSATAGNAIRSGPGQGGQLPLWRANRALVGDWVHIFGAGTVFNLRASYTYFLEWSYSDYAIGFDSTEFWPASLVNQMPSQDIGGLFPRDHGIDHFATLSRGSAPNRNRNYSLQPNVSLTRGAHNIRSGLDMRWTNVFNENYNNSGGLLNFNRDFTRSTLNSNNALEGNAFASFLLGAPSQRQRGRQPEAALQVVLRGALDPGRLARQQQADAEPRLPLGRQRFRDGREQHAELRVRPDDRQPGVGARRSAGAWAGSGSPAWTAPRIGRGSSTRTTGRAASAWPTRSTRRPSSAPATASTSSTRRARATTPGSALDTQLIASNDGGRTPTYSLSNPWPNGIQAPPGKLAGPGDVPRARPELLEPRLRRAERAPVLRGRPARAAVAHLARGDLRGKPQL